MQLPLLLTTAEYALAQHVVYAGRAKNWSDRSAAAARASTREGDRKHAALLRGYAREDAALARAYLADFFTARATA